MELGPPPQRASHPEGWNYGRFRGPIPQPDLKANYSKWRLKEWSFSSFATPRFFGSVALVQLGYLGYRAVYLVDRKQGEIFRDKEFSPFGGALNIAPSSIEGSTTWDSSRANVSQGWDNAWTMDLTNTKGGKTLQVRFRSPLNDSLSLLHPLAPDRPAYTHKAAACVASGEIQIGDDREQFDNGLVCIDWTRARALHKTIWNWASLGAIATSGKRVGVNLSAKVYDVDGTSQENAVWVDGKVFAVGSVRFGIPANPREQPWTVQTVDSDAVDLHFEPKGAMTDGTNLGFLKSNFVQPFGVFRGTIRGETVEDAFGVMEDHEARW